MFEVLNYVLHNNQAMEWNFFLINKRVYLLIRKLIVDIHQLIVFN